MASIQAFADDGIDDSNVGYEWDGFDKLGAVDASENVCSTGASGASSCLLFFDFSAVPTDAVVTGVQIDLWCRANISGDPGVVFSRLCPALAEMLIPADLIPPYYKVTPVSVYNNGGVSTHLTYGGISSLWGTRAPTAADLRAGYFAVALDTSAVEVGSFYMDAAAVTIYYQTAKRAPQSNYYNRRRRQ